MRVAWFSPLPPAASGIADYSAELVPYVARHVDVELIVADHARPTTALVQAFPTVLASAFARQADRYDLCLYQLGNNAEFHDFVYRELVRRPGVVVLHEYMLQHLVRGLTLARGDLAGYLDEVRYAYGEAIARAADEAVREGGPFDIWRYPLFERVVDASQGLIVHNRATRSRVLASRPGARMVRVPHHLSLDALPTGEAASRPACRRTLGLPADALVVGTFGLVTPHKRIEVVVRAFERLRREHPDAVLLMAGAVSPYYDVEQLLARVPREAVVLTGRLTLPRLLEAMVACDIAVNLRHPSGGETSGTLMRLLGLGRAVVVSETGSFAEVPDGCCAKVPLDRDEEPLLAAYLLRLAADPELREAMGRGARRHMEAHHTLEGSARGYVEFLERVATEPTEPFRAAPPLMPFAVGDLRLELLAELGREVADLGVDERHRELLAAAARCGVELDLDPNGGAADA